MRLLFYLLLLSSFCFGQTRSGNELDSLLQVSKREKKPAEQLELYIKISKLYPNSNPPEGIVYGEKALALAKKLKNTDRIALSEMCIGANYYNLGEIEKAHELFRGALKKTNNKETLSECYTLIGKYYLAKSDYSQALNYNMKALKLSEEVHYELGTANASYTIAIAYNYLKKPDNALKYFRKALTIHKQLKNKKGIRSNILGIATQYEYKNNFALAKKYYLEAKALAYEMNDDFAIGTTSASLGNLLFRMNEIESALQHILIAKASAERINNARALNTAKFLEGRIYLKLYQQGKSYKNVDLLSEAEKLLREGIENEKLSGNKIVITQGLEQLSEIYSIRKDYKKAKDTYVLFMRYTDSLYNEDVKQTTKSLEDQRTIDLKNKEIQVNKLTLANKEKEKWFFISGILFLLIIGGLFFYQSISRKKTNEKLQLLNAELDEANKTKTRFFSILNHDLRGPVSNLIHFLHLQKDNPELLDAESKKRMESKTITGAENLLTSMEDILLWSKGQMENFKPNPKKIALTDVFNDTEKHFSGQEKVSISFQNEGTIQLKTDENYLKTIVRNLTGNALKALEKSENPTIIWKAWQEGNQVYLSISDNGPGATQEQFRALYDEKEVVGIKSGLGLHLIRDLAKAINCKIVVDSKNEKGTTFTLQLPA